jgi:hypothetical protein
VAPGMASVRTAGLAMVCLHCRGVGGAAHGGKGTGAVGLALPLTVKRLVDGLAQDQSVTGALLWLAVLALAVSRESGGPCSNPAGDGGRQ